MGRACSSQVAGYTNARIWASGIFCTSVVANLSPGLDFVDDFQPRCDNFFQLVICFLLAGCAVTAQIINTPRSTIEQQLLVRALERAVATLDVRPFVGKTVTVVPLVGLTIPEIVLFKDVKHNGYAEIKVVATGCRHRRFYRIK